jgi:hypothetical protein
MKVRKRNGTLVISLPIIDPPRSSSSGKRLLVGTSRGARRTGLKHGEKPVYVNANAYIHPDEQQDNKKPGISKASAGRKGLRKR